MDLSEFASPGGSATFDERAGGAGGDDWFSQQGAPDAPAPPAGAAPTGGGAPSRPSDLNAALALANQVGYGGQQKHTDPSYWQALWQKDPEYAWKRMLGWQAEGADAPTSGPYAGQGGGGGGAGFGGGGGPRPYGTSAAPEATPFSYERFQAPELNESTDPGFAARLAEGLKGVERSAASKGTLLTGGTLKGLNRYAQDYASNEYQNVFNRALGAYNTNFNTAFQPWQANFNNAYQSWQGNLGAQNQGYNQLSGLANIGANAAAGTGAAGSNYANQGSNLLTDAGNAAAAGTVGGANAWQAPIGQATNAAQMYYLSQLLKPKVTA